MSSWGDRATIERLRKQVRMLRESLFTIEDYCTEKGPHDVRELARRELDRHDKFVLSSETS